MSSSIIVDGGEDMQRRRWPYGRTDFASVEDLRQYITGELKLNLDEFRAGMPIHLWTNQVPFLDQI